MSDQEALERDVAPLRRNFFLAGAAGLAASAAGFFLAPTQFFRSYLFACAFWGGLTIGCLVVLLLRTITGGSWGVPIRRPLESVTRLFPLVALFFVPLLFGLKRLYEWARPEEVAHDRILRAKSLYLNVPFFLGRSVLYFGVWVLLAYFFNRWSLEQDRAPGHSVNRRLQLLASGGFVACGLMVTFWSVDWLMSLEPHWFSTIYGLLLLSGQALSGLAFITAATILLARRKPLSDVLTPGRLHDLGKLMLAFVMFWAYIAFSQYLIIWSGNLPEEIPWYLRRLQGGWGWFGVAVVILHFALPFLLLLPADANRNPRLLAGVALLVLGMRFVDLFWLVRPAFTPARFDFHWMDVAAPLGLGGVWLGFFLQQLFRRPLVPRNDPQLLETSPHAAH